MKLVLTLSVLRRSFREAYSIRRSTFSVLLRRVRRVYLTLEPNTGGIYSHPYPPTGHASAAGHARLFQGFPFTATPDFFLKIIGPILAPRWPPRSPTWPKSSILCPSWAQYRPTWSPRCPDKPLQDARIAKNLEKTYGKSKFLLSQPCAKTPPKSSLTPPKIVQVTSKMAPKLPELRPSWPS